MLDIAIISIIVLSGVLGLLRGAIREILGLIGLIVAAIISQQMSEFIADMLAPSIPSANVVGLLSFALPFMVVLIIWGVLAGMLTPRLRPVVFYFFDRPLGFLLGLGRGVILVALFYMAGLLLVQHEDGLPHAVREAATMDVIRNVSIWLAEQTPESMGDEIISKIPPPNDSLLPDELAPLSEVGDAYGG